MRKEMRLSQEKELAGHPEVSAGGEQKSRAAADSGLGLGCLSEGPGEARSDFGKARGVDPGKVVEEKAVLIGLEKAGAMIEAGWQAADLHVHTYYSYDVVPTRAVDPLVLYEKARARGMSFVSFTDHDTMNAYDRVGWSREGLVPGVEVKILDPDRVGHTVHINVYMLSGNQFEEIERIARGAQNIELLLDYLRTENLPFTFNHPFWHEPGEKLNARAVVELAEKFPVLEYNLGRIRKLNRLVLELAAEKKKGVAAGTDSHAGDIGRIFTVARGRNFREFFESIKNGQSYLVTEDLNYNRIKSEILERLEMLIDSHKWVMGKEELRLETGNALADALIKILSGGRAEIAGVKRALLKGLAGMISRTGIPAMIYLRNQNMLASRIRQELNLAV
ncbi:MAG: PHP domain-containing protein [Candidatus Saccharicenans sp.]